MLLLIPCSLTWTFSHKCIIHNNKLFAGTFFSAASVEACQKNIKFNGSVAISKVESHLADARVYMLTHPKEFDVVCILYLFNLDF